MIRNERELQAALEWIDYWKSTRSAGQSWIGDEQAAQKIIELRKQIDAYRAVSQTSEPAPGNLAAVDQSASSTV